jgi:hypothetical protein
MSTTDNNTILILVVSVLIVGTLYLLLKEPKEPKEQFHPYSDVNINKSNMIMNNTNNTYDKENNKLNSEIIAKGKDRDNYPLGTNKLEIIPPMIPNKTLDINAAYQENKYIRDEGINEAITELKNEDKEDYKEVASAYNNFLLPIDSNDELSFKKYKDFTKNELDESTLKDLYTKMTSSVSKKLSAAELERISGKPVIDNKLSGLYKPIYISYDNDFDMDKTIDNYEYKFEGFSSLPNGSLI